MSHNVADCNPNDSTTYSDGELPVAREVAPGSKTDPRAVALEALKGLPREELLGLLADLMQGGGKV